MKPCSNISAVAIFAMLSGAASAGELGRPMMVGPPLVERPEMRSYQPYSGLQFGFRPERPGKRGIRPKKERRPKVVMPEAVAPLIEYGARHPHASQYYRYCAPNARCR